MIERIGFEMLKESDIRDTDGKTINSEMVYEINKRAIKLGKFNE